MPAVASTKPHHAHSPISRSEVLELINGPFPPKAKLTLVRPVKEPVATFDFPDPFAADALEQLSGRWTYQVLWALRKGPVRLNALHRILPRSSKKMLTETLRRLEAAGLLYRCDLSGKVRHVEYRLSPAISAELDVLMDALTRWGEAFARRGTPGPSHEAGC